MTNTVSVFPVMETPLPQKLPWSYWSERFINRQEEYLTTYPTIENNFKINFSEDVCLNLIGDTHIGAPFTQYKRFEKEIEVISKTKNSYLLLFGDVIDGFFFNPAQMEQIEQVPEQFAYMQSLIEYLGSLGKLLIGWGGDHDTWAKKMGVSAYADFSERTKGYYVQGVGYLWAGVGEQLYKLAGAHRHTGFSITNKAQASLRLYSSNAEGADVCVTAHTHKKCHLQQSVREFGGSARLVDYISLGTYKRDDDYGQKLGFGRSAEEEMFGSAIILRKAQHEVNYYHDILKANEELRGAGV